jgi:pimeloyl-ACP methyl ester carboxylesterase
MGHRLGAGTSAAGSLGGAFSTGGGKFASSAPSGTPGVWQITFGDPGTGWQESFLLGIPPVPLSPAPLLVMFHSFSVSEWDCYYNTPLMKDAMIRGWYVVAPLGAHQLNYGITYSQTNVEVVLDWIDEFFPVDRSRVYGVGFSMGGGAAASYAARHLDPDHLRFAAVVNHTGSVSLSHTYWSVNDPWVFDDPIMFGGSPTTYPFDYARSSMFDLALDGVTVDPDTDMAGNLVHVPLLDVAATEDPIQYLRTQTRGLHEWMGTLGGIETFEEPDFSVHDWTTLDSQGALDFLEAQTLTTPTEGVHSVLADRDGGWHHFYVYQDRAGAFTPFRFAVDSALNQLVIDETKNLQRLVVDPAALSLDSEQDLVLVFGTQDGRMETMTLTGYPSPPSQVLRDGNPSGNYIWEAVGETLTLYEYDASSYPAWTIVP